MQEELTGLHRGGDAVSLEATAISWSGGFVLRALAGGVAAPVALSRWFVLVVTFAAVFVGAGVLALAAYCGWALQLPAVHGVPWRTLTLVPVVVAIGRYSALVRAGHGEAPEDLVLGDRILALARPVWVALFALGVHAAG